MPRVCWPLHGGRPRIEIVLTQALDGKPTVRNILSDTGAGSDAAAFELVLDENDCLLCGNFMGMTGLGGAYSGSFPIYALHVHIPLLAFEQDIRVVGVPTTPTGLDGIAGFRFLNRFTYGNFGDKGQFGIES